MKADDLNPAIVTALCGPEAYPEEAAVAGSIEHVQTHLSHVFLTSDRVYKLHKSVRLEFVDFSTRDARNRDALREVRLNRRLAGDVYLGVAPVLESGRRPRVGPFSEELTQAEAGGPTPEHCVVMRRLPEGRDALSLLERGKLGRDHVSAIAELIADFHRGHPLPAPLTGDEWRRRTIEPVHACFAELRAPDLPALAALADGATRAFARDHAQRFERRRVDGRGVDGHGDLHLQHLWFPRGSSDPIAIDCIAFREDFRRIDAAADVAFLAMDLEYREQRPLAEHFLECYASAADDHDLYGVVDFFIAYRAAVRAKVASIASRDPELEPGQRERAAQSARAHLHLVLEALQRPGSGGAVVLSGIVGTGKSTVARALAERVGGVVISSDRVRKALAGLHPRERAAAAWKRGLYDEKTTRSVYASLLDRARTVVASGRLAILDATYATRAQREELLCALADLAGPRLLLETVCDPDKTLERLEARARADTDASDVGPELYAKSAASYEPPDEWPAADRFCTHTDRAGWRASLAPVVARLR